MKIKIPFLNSSSDHALAKIEAALATMETAQRQRQQLQNDLETIGGSIHLLEAQARRANDRVQDLKARIEQEKDQYGNQPKALVDALAEASREYAEASRQYGR